MSVNYSLTIECDECTCLCAHCISMSVYYSVMIECDECTILCAHCISMFLYESVSCGCVNLSDEPVLFCICLWKCIVHVWMAPGKIGYKLTESTAVHLTNFEEKNCSIESWFFSYEERYT